LAHTGGHTEGKAMGRKAWLKTVLPISRPLHHVEERNRTAFWDGVGITDYLDWAERLFDIFEAGGDPTALFMDMRDRANDDFMAQILRKAA
jgi:hypothetical protein